MSPRGKKRSPTAAAVAVAAAAAHSEPTSPPEPDGTLKLPEHHTSAIPSHGLRRSSRRTTKPRGTTVGPDKGAGIFPSASHLQKMKEKGLSAEDSVERLKRQTNVAEDGVAYAMQSLEEMELHFKRDVKRRKLQVEQSFIKEIGDQAHPPLKPRSGESRSLKVDHLLLTPEKEEENDEPQVEWEPGAEVEEEASDESLEAADRGAKRAPAVNSDFLPLPWKGRLGYVCTWYEHSVVINDVLNIFRLVSTHICDPQNLQYSVRELVVLLPL